jgi:hypothetical protein
MKILNCCLIQIQTRLCSFICIGGKHFTINFGKFHLLYKLLTNKNENILLAECPVNLAPNTATKGVICLPVTPVFHNESLGHFANSAKHAEELNEMFE